MIVKIVCAGADFFEKLYKEDENEVLVGVDGGIYSIIKLGKTVNLALGDFDSCNIEEVVMHCDKVKIFPTAKDYGDLELAVQEVTNEYKLEKIIIYNGTGGRLDHFHALINVLIKYSKYNIEVIDDRNLIRVITNNTAIRKSNYTYCSIFPLEDQTKITLKGFKYPLNNYELKKLDNICLSNEIIDVGLIFVNDKKLLVIETL